MLDVSPSLRKPMVVARAGELSVEALSGVSEIPEADWTRLFPDEGEGWPYYTAIERSPPGGFRFEALAVRDQGRLVCAAPVFRIDYRLDTPLQGRLRPLGDWLYRNLPSVVAHPVIGLGSPLTDRCHLGFDPDLDAGARKRALEALLQGLDAKAAADKIRIVAIKDLAIREAEGAIDATIRAAGFARTTGLPVCVLDLPFKSDADYLRSLSANNRSVMRRKLKKAGPVELETVTSIDGIENEIYELYEETRTHSRTDYGDFEKVSLDYFRDVAKALGPKRVAIILARLSGCIVAMKFLFVEKDRVIDKFWGMRQQEGREHNLYFVCWMEAVRFTLRHGATQLQSGQTTYGQKVKFGSRLDPMWVYFRHRWPLVNRIFGRVAPLIAFDKMDPELAEVRKWKGE